MLNLHKNVKVGDKFQNPENLTTNTIVMIETNHWYSGSRDFGEFYHVKIEEKNKMIELTPGLLSRFIKI